MTRSDFLSLLGLGLGAACIGCLDSCKKNNTGPEVPRPTTVDFTLDLTQATIANRLTVGGYLYHQGVIIACTATATYVAVSQWCTHQGTSLTYDPTANDFFCPNHAAEFDLKGLVVTQPTEGSVTPLKTYTTTLTGTNLRVQG